MSGYNSHRLFNYIIFIAIAVFIYYKNIFHFDIEHLFAMGLGFYIGTEFITPDLDTNSAAYKRWGMLRILLFPYKLAFKHRQTSHNIFYGAIVRILYISVIVLGLYYLLFRSLPTELKVSPVLGMIFIIGIIIANALHVIMDKCF